MPEFLKDYLGIGAVIFIIAGGVYAYGYFTADRESALLNVVPGKSLGITKVQKKGEGQPVVYQVEQPETWHSAVKWVVGGAIFIAVLVCGTRVYQAHVEHQKVKVKKAELEQSKDG